MCWRLGPWLQGNKGIKWIKPSMVKKVAKVTHAIASGGTSKNWHFDFSDVAISIEISQNFTGWAIYMGFCWIPQFLPTIQSTINLKMDGATTKLSNENSAIWNRWNRAFTGFQHGIQWVEMGWNGLKHVWVIPLQSTPLRTLLRSAFKCRMAPKICASFEIRISPTWSNCQKMSKAWIVF